MDDNDEGDEDEEDYSSGDSVEVIQETQVQEEEVQSKKIQVRPWEMQICTIYSRVAELFGANTFLARLLHVRFYTCIFTASLARITTIM